MPNSTGDGVNGRDLELILHEIESLPTLSSVAVRVLDISGRDDAEIKEIVKLVESDPALSTRILSMCQRADRTKTREIVTVERAVVLLGIEAVRAALLSVELFKIADLDTGDAESAFDREGFWRHSLGVACASELIARSEQGKKGVEPAMAFVGGLLHDLGKLALHWVLPKAYDRVLRAAERSRSDLASIERRALSVDHHVAGKRLAEHWRLPHALQDVMWFCGQTPEMIPELPHKDLIGIVSAGNALSRSLHVGWSGDASERIDFAELCEAWGINAESAEAAGEGVHSAVGERARLLGIDDEPCEKLLLESIGQANRRLGALAGVLEERSNDRGRLMRGLNSIHKFARRAQGGTSIADVCGEVMESAASLGAQGEERMDVLAVLWRAREGTPWRLFSRSPHGQTHSRTLEGDPRLDADGFGQSRAGEMTLADTDFLQWARASVEQAFEGRAKPGRLCFLPLANEGGTTALLVHNAGGLAPRTGDDVLATIAAIWGQSILWAARHAGARLVSERLSQANMKLAEAQSALVEARSMAVLGRMTAGAAHEMNNPLMVISGNAQKLRRLVRGDDAVNATKKLVQASENLSELIAALHFLASPPEPRPGYACVDAIVTSAIETACSRYKQEEGGLERISVELSDDLPEVWADAAQMRQAIAELVLNGLESANDAQITIRARLVDSDGRVEMEIADTGPGMSRSTLDHACDPFYSHRDAGRGVGLGLARSRRFAEMNRCWWKLDSKVGVGTTAWIGIPIRSGTEAATGRAA